MTFVRELFAGSWLVLADAAPWLLVSYALSGLLHEFVSPGRMQRELGNRRISSLAKATFSGMLLPICSCGAIPIGLSLYYSGAYLGPALAFMVASPMINPAAIFLSYGLLGPQIASIYLASGIVIPMLVGLAGNAWAGDRLAVEDAGVPRYLPTTAEGSRPLGRRIADGVRYGYGELGVTVSRYVVIGALSAGLLFAVVPSSFIERYLADPGMISLFGISVLGATMYVCAVGHIPFIAAIVAAGAAPGTAVTFLMAGAATNLPEFISISKLISAKTALLYSGAVVFLALVAGWITNLVLADGFLPVIDPEAASGTLRIANWLVVSVPLWLQVVSAGLVVGLGAWSYRSRFASLLRRVPGGAAA